MNCNPLWPSMTNSYAFFSVAVSCWFFSSLFSFMRSYALLSFSLCFLVRSRVRETPCHRATPFRFFKFSKTWSRISSLFISKINGLGFSLRGPTLFHTLYIKPLGPILAVLAGKTFKSSSTWACSNAVLSSRGRAASTSLGEVFANYTNYTVLIMKTSERARILQYIKT